ncbi:MAG: hypothetical protein EZS28_049526, partial [Streblomastix strix]
MVLLALNKNVLESTATKTSNKKGKVLLGLDIHIREDNEIVKVHEHDKGSRVSHKF